MTARRTLAAGLITAVMLALGACGSGDADSETGTETVGGSPGGALERFETERVAFNVDPTWTHSPLENVTTVLMSGMTVFDEALWRGEDPVVEVLTYRFYGQGSQPRDEEAPADAIAKALDEGVQAYASMQPDSLGTQLTETAQGCVGPAEFLTEPERFDPPGLQGLRFQYECDSTGMRQSAWFAMFIDTFGDRHQITISTDPDTAEQQADRYLAILGSIEAIG
ncbi:MAG: hypothetical protein Q4G67_01565 [Actinomycetia bacterium]|nr:hypothetical protein [Actinomycetes bacterium]